MGNGITSREGVQKSSIYHTLHTVDGDGGGIYPVSLVINPIHFLLTKLRDSFLMLRIIYVDGPFVMLTPYPSCTVFGLHVSCLHNSTKGQNRAESSGIFQRKKGSDLYSSTLSITFIECQLDASTGYPGSRKPECALVGHTCIQSHPVEFARKSLLANVFTNQTPKNLHLLKFPDFERTKKRKSSS